MNYNLTEEQMARLYKGYLINVKNGYVYVNDYGDLEFMDSESLVDETVPYNLESEY